MEGALSGRRRRCAGARPHRHRAVTLVELAIAMAVLGILATLAIPYFRHLIADVRMTSQINGLYTSLLLARSEAIKRGRTVYVCKSDSGQICTSDSSWDRGWIVFADENDSHQRDGDEPVLHVQQALSAQLRFELRAPADGQYVRFKPLGTSWPNGTFTFCDTRGPAHARALVIYHTGRPRVAAVRPDGKPLDCSWYDGDA